MMLLLLSIIVGAVVLWCFFHRVSNTYKHYKLPGKLYLVKKAVCYVLLKRMKCRKQHVTNNWLANYLSCNKYLDVEDDPTVKDRPQQIQNNPHAIDGAFFAGFAQDNTNVIFSLCRGQDRCGDICVFLDLPGIGQLQHPVQPDTEICNMNPRSFSASGLTFEMLQPMLRWKVSYNGEMRVGLCNDLENKPEKYVHVRLSFIWSSFTDPFHFDTDIDPCLTSDAIAREDWNEEFWNKLKSEDWTHYEQWGELLGTVSVDGHEERTLILKSVRDHSFGVLQWKLFHRYVRHYIYVETGLVAMISVVSHKTLSHFKYGYMFYPNGDKMPVSDISLNLWDVGEDGEPPKHYNFTFKAGSKTFEVNVQGGITPVCYHSEDHGGKTIEMICKFTVNGKPGRGLTEYFYRNYDGPHRESKTSIPLLTEPDYKDVDDAKHHLVLKFTDGICSATCLVGGKGSQLALLTKIQLKMDATVPRGICVTLRAFETHLEYHPKLVAAILAVKKIAVKGSVKELQTVCSDTVTLINTADVNSNLQAAILENLEDVFGKQFNEKRFAIRSSAAGEDGKEASSAGQLETFLGVKGSTELLTDAVRKCWASAFTFQTVEYRRQHGQPLDSSVGVVIQEMVSADVSGVLFTIDPRTGNPCQMVINANYGLGESIVSGKTNPDIIHVHRSWDDKLEITDKKLGDKNMIIKMAESGGTEEEGCEMSKCTEICLSKEDILLLSQTGIKIEKYFGRSCDIEWALKNGKVYVLQCRPVTTQELESDEDLIHEFDSALSTETEWLTRGNIGEMMPKAVTPLTWSVFIHACDFSLTELFCLLGSKRNCTHFSALKSVVSFCNHAFLNMKMITSSCVTTTGANKDMCELNILGEKLDKLTKEDVLEYFGEKNSLIKRWTNLFTELKGFYSEPKKMKEWDVILETFSIGDGCSSAIDLYRDISSNVPEYFKMMKCAMIVFAVSGSWNYILKTILSQGTNKFTAEMDGDVALLLSECPDVISANVPFSMQELAKQIVEEGLENEFLNSPDSECFDLLMSKKNTELYNKTVTFFKKHGHRCIREAEMREESWETNPAKLMHILKALVKAKSYNVKPKELLTVAEIISRLQSPITTFGKLILKTVLPKARAGVSQREWAKSQMIKMSDIIKKAYRQLAGFMVEEGRIPEKDLIFFMTHDEIGQLLKTRSARIIMKSFKRRRIYPQQMSKTFTKTFQGHPQPLPELKNDTVYESVAELSGFPVSIGKVKGTARVVLNLDEAEIIQAGDILVVTITDVGWTPYFPLIAALITETGGSVSHGAVVAREYGIPCVVNVPLATVLIKSGEQLLVDGRKGTIHKLTETAGNSNTD